MKWLIFIPLMLITSGCFLNREYVVVCPVPKDVPAAISYRTDALPLTISSATVIQYMLTDLMQCQDTEAQLRTILKGYEK